MRYKKYTGIILKKTPVRDADYFFSILTPDAGKLSVYGHGVRSIKSKRRASLDYFSEIIFEVTEKQGRQTLTNVELKNSFRHSKSDLYDISRLFQIGELIDALVPEGVNDPSIYQLLNKAINNIDRFDTPAYLIRFKRRLLALLGFGEPTIDDHNLDTYLESIIEKPLRAKII